MADLCCLNETYHSDLDEVIEHHSKYWKSLQSPELINYTERVKKNKKKVFGLVDD